ncbi:DNA topology modulation protein FlaR [Algicella marina]|uniref:DNA topology modulation protein FlaR n=1 Tax=Algicella marina TaxID=2683284 RepID=A0A6P1T5E6_9RHOB|nr:DNA topology modulation protein FlaR [Algicella marina]QHQ36975.1 DNA topology modulation protein FlaR [Algicella marina]
MQRVMIIGGPGSGKTTLALELGERTGLPVFHMDQIHHLPGWVERDREEKGRLCSEVHARERWIFEGNHSAAYPERVARADTCIWLDLPVSLRLARVVWRTLRHYGQDRPSLPENCPERFSREFFAFIWRTRNTTRVRPLAIKADPPPHLTFVHITSVAELRRYLASLNLTVCAALAQTSG